MRVQPAMKQKYTNVFATSTEPHWTVKFGIQPQHVLKTSQSVYFQPTEQDPFHRLYNMSNIPIEALRASSLPVDVQLKIVKNEM
jgi:hypothetical protein